VPPAPLFTGIPAHTCCRDAESILIELDIPAWNEGYGKTPHLREMKNNKIKIE
jgi:hypothetical protein